MNKKIETYRADGRPKIQDLYKLFYSLKDDFIVETVARAPLAQDNGETVWLPIIRARTKVHKNRPAVIGIYSTHGKEPEGTIAAAKSVQKFKEMSQDLDLVLYLMANPAAYCKDRYHLENLPNSRRVKVSSTDCGYLVYKTPNGEATTYKDRRHITNDLMVNSFVQLFNYGYNFILAVDHHGCEDSHHNGLPFNFHNGPHPEIAKTVSLVMKQHKSPLRANGYTQDGYRIIDGAIYNYHDGSLGDFLAQNQFRHPVTGLRTTKPELSVMTIETQINGTALYERVKVHKAIIEIYPKLVSQIVRSKN